MNMPRSQNSCKAGGNGLVLQIKFLFKVTAKTNIKICTEKYPLAPQKWSDIMFKHENKSQASFQYNLQPQGCLQNEKVMSLNTIMPAATNMIALGIKQIQF